MVDFTVSPPQSYAGKYVPALAHYIHALNPAVTLKINLKGIALGDAYFDPESVGGSFFLSLWFLKEIKSPLVRGRLLLPWRLNFTKGKTVAQLTNDLNLLIFTKCFTVSAFDGSLGWLGARV